MAWLDPTFPGLAQAIVDSLVLGCIPVLFHVGQARQWPWHWGAWQRDASVVFDMDAINGRRCAALVGSGGRMAARMSPNERR